MSLQHQPFFSAVTDGTHFCLDEKKCHKYFHVTFIYTIWKQALVNLIRRFIPKKHIAPNSSLPKPCWFKTLNFFLPSSSVNEEANKINSFLLMNMFRTNQSLSDIAGCGSAVRMLTCSPKTLTALCWFLSSARLQTSDRMAN